MTEAILLTPHQADAVDWVIEQMLDEAPLVALRGLAGTGKTSIIPTLRALLASHDRLSVVGSPTHRAAMVLRKKGVKDATTVHRLALTPYFKADYAHACRWLGDDAPCRPEEWEKRAADIEGVPAIIWEAQRGRSTSDVKRLARRHGVKKALGSIGIQGKEHFDGFGPKDGEGILIIDEASMVGAKMLALCTQAFEQVILIGDPGQLPPVSDEPVLQSAEGVDLTEIHRQAAGSPITQLAYAARAGKQNWRQVAAHQGSVLIESSLDPAVFLHAPLIVWRNETRIECTTQIRAQLGYPARSVVPGEPLVCRATHAADRAEGFVNNSLWRVVGTTKDGLTTVQEEGREEEEPVNVLLHMEEIDGEDIDPEAIPFRFGYCLTAHTAQGGEWPTVVISKPDLLDYQARCRKNKKLEDLQQWTYTAITRGKQTVVFLQQHVFTPQRQGAQPMPIMEATEESGPQMLHPAEAQALIDAQPQRESPTPTAGNDIPEPLVPPGAFATVPALPDNLVPLAHGFCQYMQNLMHGWIVDEHRALMKTLDASLENVRHWARESMQAPAQSTADSMAALAQGLPLLNPPYQVVLQVKHPTGFPVQLTISKATAEELISELARLIPWLEKQGYVA